MATSKQIAIENILRLEKAATILQGSKAAAMRDQAFKLRLKWGLAKSERLNVEEQWDEEAQKRPERPAYRNSKYALEKYAKVDPNRRDSLGKYYQPSANRKAVARPDSIEVRKFN